MSAHAELAGRLDRAAAVAHALREGLIHKGEAALGLLLVDFADARGVLRGLGYHDLADLLACSKRTVARGLARLCELGLVRRLQAGIGRRRASYAVVENAVRGDLTQLRRVSRGSHGCPHPRETALSSPLTPLPLRLSARAPAAPEELAQALERRVPRPEGLERAARRELVHLAAAYARRHGRLRNGANLLGWILSRVPARILPRWCIAADHAEARRTLAEADRRNRGAPGGPALHVREPSRPPGPRAASAQPGPSESHLTPDELRALGNLNRELLGDVLCFDS